MDTLVLVRFRWRGERAPDDLASAARRCGAALQQAIDGDDGCVYLDAASAAALVPAECRTLHHLQPTLRLPGAADGEPARFHYVVATDIVAGGDAELNAWYDEEHLPGLAAVPGVVQAQRFVDPAGSPRYYAAYELARLEAFNSPPWLAVRATPWSTRVRSGFRNTRRTMYRRLAP